MIITVVTPTLNGMPYLRECIESVRKNHSPNYEVEHIIVDGGSTDETLEVARSYGLRIIAEKDEGIFDAINKGSFNSRGDLLGFLGSDDLMLEGALEAVAKGHRESGRRWIVGGIRWINEHGANLGQLRAPPGWMSARMHVCLDWNPIMHMSTYFTRDLYSQLGGFNIAYKDAGDFDMFARALAQEPFERVPQQLICFRRTGHNNSVVNRDRASRDPQAVRDRFGPKSDVERQFWKYLLKGWFNLGNPDWLVRKVAGNTRFQLGLQPKQYF